nr:uncharacterized protein LOC127484245 [Oryctolagus cuniculus]XP_051680136.1 uncharacterized protein LOC127484245 [Oryctolagus cuniculus]XP_051680137.1 uncharacterized protein LOC127484245 [Oryctolagus cuniculus]
MKRAQQVTPEWPGGQKGPHGQADLAFLLLLHPPPHGLGISEPSLGRLRGKGGWARVSYWAATLLIRQNPWVDSVCMEQGAEQVWIWLENGVGGFELMNKLIWNETQRCRKSERGREEKRENGKSIPQHQPRSWWAPDGKMMIYRSGPVNKAAGNDEKPPAAAWWKIWLQSVGLLVILLGNRRAMNLLSGIRWRRAPLGLICKWWPNLCPWKARMRQEWWWTQGPTVVSVYCSRWPGAPLLGQRLSCGWCPPRGQGLHLSCPSSQCPPPLTSVCPPAPTVLLLISPCQEQQVLMRSSGCGDG